MTQELQLLVEHWGQPYDVSEIKATQLDESSSTGLRPGLYIEGIFLQANVVNRNKRMYPKSILEQAIDRYMTEQVKTCQALGELNHPPRAMVDPMQAAIIIEDMWWEGDNVYGRARVVEGDNGAGDKLAALIRAGWKPGVSSRGLGQVKSSGRGYNIVQEGFRLTVGVDVVWGPSAPDAWVTPKEITESVVEDTVVTKPSADSAFNSLIENMNAL
ncbi:gp21 prohead core scaffold protein and protease [Acinetobacter phage Acj61]|jgi:hypothetical protein|uniref:Gp21 prohead core scaffold protein and protease n=1 Tax=Acinetobacter phage Acj61 TaxID=760732 RepID=E5E4G3_9CAUD|nr:gp21 prohead core scaffold protein and protease [Acinetobacter phage Acj61]ADG36147.1 gp21 prohead core scaffold protein and protease [Acinetobacter phage Acj61]